jgi:hypothetical protein
LSSNLEEAARYERLSKSTGDRELSAYYAAKAKELRSPAAQIAAAREQLEEVKRRVTSEVTQEVWAQKARRASTPTSNKLVEQTARQGLLANATAASNEAREHERRANEAEHTSNLSSDRTIYRHYQDVRREHLALAELARSRESSFRRAAANVGQ